MKTSKILILVAVALLVFGSAGFFAYELFLKPYGCHFPHLFHSKTKTVATAPTPDPGLAGFDAAVALQNAGKLLEAQTAWQLWVQAHPDSPKQREAIASLGTVNMQLLCSAASTANKESYTVVKGDSLARIASRQKSNAELIQRVNGLPNINLQIGEVLLIPQLQISIDIDPAAHLLTLRDHDQFLKSYVLLAAPTESSSKDPVTTAVVDKIAMSDGGKRAAFGDKKYLTSERAIILRSSGNIVTAPAENLTASTNEEATSTKAEGSSNKDPQVMPAGYVLSATDINEIFPFVTKGTAVTVH